MAKLYYPYPSDKPNKKYFITTSSGHRVYFGQAGYNDYIIYNRTEGRDKAERRKKHILQDTRKWVKIGESLVLILQGG